MQNVVETAHRCRHRPLGRTFVAPGYWLWVIIGLIVGYLAELWAKRGENTGEAAN